jgi:predicted O-methyltransferase YrrM
MNDVINQWWNPFIQQQREEFTSFIAAVEEYLGQRPRKILDIGTNKGGTALMFQHIASEGCISIDIRGREVGIPDAWFPKVHFIVGDSSSPEVIAEIQQNGPYDLIFIDGDHSYDGTKKDWELAKTLISSPGVIGFHDIGFRRYKDMDSEIYCGVVFEEIVNGQEHETTEFFVEFGIGMVKVK